MYKGNGLLFPWYEVHNPGLKKKINWGEFPGMSAYWGVKKPSAGEGEPAVMPSSISIV